MPHDIQCPDQARLSELLLGTLDEHKMEEVGSHLLACQRCAARAGTISASDALTVSLRGSDTFLSAESDPLVQRLRSQLHQLRVPSPPSPVDAATLSISSPTEASVSHPASVSSAAAEKSRFTFLGDPQAEDEIGCLGPYRVLKVLGQGGMGVVFQAEDTRLGRLCALKAMLPETAAKSGMKERFLREARAAAQIEHDHIIPIYQVDEDRGVPYIAMPFLKGMSLEDWIRKQAKANPAGASIPVPVIIKLGRQIAKGLAAAHDRGLIHRDIKPGNIWLDASAGGRVKILDFGLARLSEAVDQQHLTQTGMIMGTPSHMAPEQARGGKLDGRADLFSLGVILYRLCTGRLPFQGKDTMATLMALATHTPPAPHTVNRAIPQSLSDVVMHLLEKEPAERTPSAQQLLADLQSIEKDLSANGSESLALAAASATSQQDSGALPNATFQPRSQAVGPPRRPHVRWPLIAAAAAGVAVMLAGVVLFWQTPYGTVRIEINDPSITAQIDADGVDIRRGKKPLLHVEPGNHYLRVKHGDLEFDTSSFELSKGETVDLKVEMLTGLIRVTADGKEIASRQLSAAGIPGHGGRAVPAASAAVSTNEPAAAFQPTGSNARIVGRPSARDPKSPPIPKLWTLRTIAEWSIEKGGKILLGDGRVLSKVDELPDTVDRIDLVDLSGLKASFGDAEAKIAGTWPLIKGIAVSDTAITDAALRDLAALPLGNSFSASSTSITGEGFDAFRDKSLGTISLSSCQLSPQGWRHIAAIGRTTAWHLQFSNLNDAALANIISAHPEIETLNASCRDVTDASAAAIASITEIRTLALNTANISDETLEKLTGLKWLKTLQVQETKVTAAGVEQLQKALPDCTITWK